MHCTFNCTFTLVNIYFTMFFEVTIPTHKSGLLYRDKNKKLVGHGGDFHSFTIKIPAAQYCIRVQYTLLWDFLGGEQRPEVEEVTDNSWPQEEEDQPTSTTKLITIEVTQIITAEEDVEEEEKEEEGTEVEKEEEKEEVEQEEEEEEEEEEDEGGQNQTQLPQMEKLFDYQLVEQEDIFFSFKVLFKVHSNF